MIITLLLVAAALVLAVLARPGTFWSSFISPFASPLTASSAGTSVRWHGSNAAASNSQSPLTFSATSSPAAQTTEGAPAAGWLKPGRFSATDEGRQAAIRV